MKKKQINIRNVKKITIASLIFLGGYTAYSQLTVYDPNNDKNQTENRLKLVKQIKLAQEQAEKLKGVQEQISKNLKYVEQVNNNIKNVQKVRNIIKNQSEIYKQIFALKNKFRNADAGITLQLEQTTNDILAKTQSDIEELSKIINTGIFNMNDNDRLNQIEKYEAKTYNQLASIDELESMYKHSSEAMEIYNHL